jgi:hypothetical protein
VTTEIESDSESQMRQAPRSQPRRRTFRVAAIIICACSMLPATAWGASDTLSMSVAPASPEQGVPATFTFTGEAASTGGEGEGTDLLVEYRPTGGIGCQATFENDRQAAGEASTELASPNDEGRAPWNSENYDNPPVVGPGPFSAPFTYAMPAPGTYLFCAYLEHREKISDEEYKQVLDAATTLTIQVTPPKISAFAVGLPRGPQPGQVFVIAYTTQTDQTLTLATLIQHAGGLPCAASPELDEQENQTQDRPTFPNPESFYEGRNSVNIFGGPLINQATDTETLGGPYIICSWITGPTKGEVDAALTTPFYVGTPPPPPPSAQKPAPASDTCLRDRENVAHEELIVRRYERRLRAHHLSRRTRRSDSKALAHARKTLSKDQGLRHHQCPNGK